MLSRMLIGLVGAAGAAVMSVPGTAAADDPPPLPNINAFAPVKTSEYAVMDNNWYAFSTPDGLTCVLQRTGSYGCSGPIPAAPNGANLVSGGPGAPSFANSPAPVFAVVSDAKPLPANSRISYQTISCGTDGVMTSCIDGRTQAGFVISPSGSFAIGDRPSEIKPSVTIG
ncbi:hypothetical protein M1247_10940 [Mycobacterium sp. 21AC1]|uniref:hypothetical protein n=1 Tax=[Mycobacterium] appelbergii TaxID=2939269 RepID=UPI002938FF01|nr:hypothetical protein [Mycobacterium sp. 21AC1]MDV3125429.1 hypothetical protein [Mycobacterium sp. 21AC1]